jgi:hypothetical protein
VIEFVQGFTYEDGSAITQQRKIGDPTDPEDYARNLYRVIAGLLKGCVN